MTGHIAFAGFVLTAEEWAELQPELEPLVATTPTLAVGSGPIVELTEIEDDATPVAVSVTVTGSVLVGA